MSAPIEEPRADAPVPPACNVDRLLSAWRGMQRFGIGLLVWLVCIFVLVGASYAVGRGTPATKIMFACWVAAGVALLIGLAVSFVRYRASFAYHPGWLMLMIADLIVLAPVHIVLACAGGGFRPSLVRTADARLAVLARHHGLDKPPALLEFHAMETLCERMRSDEARCDADVEPKV